MRRIKYSCNKKILIFLFHNIVSIRVCTNSVLYLPCISYCICIYYRNIVIYNENASLNNFKEKNIQELTTINAVKYSAKWESVFSTSSQSWNKPLISSPFKSLLHTNISLIFHHVYKTLTIPSVYFPGFRSIMTNHKFVEKNFSITDMSDPGFRYFFWEDKTINAYIEDKIKLGDTSYRVFNLTRHTLEKADIIRYFILYEFGGIYLDLDVELFGSIVPYLNRGYPCMLTIEPPEQTIMWENLERVVSNAVMMCRPRHPFMKFLIHNLENSLKKKTKDIVYSTGPFFVTEALARYRAKMTLERPTIAALCNTDASAHPDCVHDELESLFEDVAYIHLKDAIGNCKYKLTALPKGIQQRCREMFSRMSKYNSVMRRGHPPEKFGVHYHFNIGHINGGIAPDKYDLDIRVAISGYWAYNKEKGIQFIKTII